MKNAILYASVFILWQSTNAVAGAWVGSAKVGTINANANDKPATAVTLVGQTFPGCTVGSSAMMPFDHPSYKSFLSLLIAAKMSGTDTKIFVEGCDLSGYPIVKEVAIF